MQGIKSATRARYAIASRIAEAIEAGKEPDAGDVESLRIFDKKISALKGLLMKEGK
jgi:hypothetical protein